MQMMPHQMQQMQMQAPSQTSNCPACNTPLSFPYGSMYIQCPTCSTAFNPQPPPLPQQPMQPIPASSHAGPTNYINCFQCNALLSHPPTSVTIQCPKCLLIMDTPGNVPARAAAVNVMHHVSGAGSGGGGGSGGTGGGRERGEGGGGSRESTKEAMALRKKRKDPNAPKRASNAYMVTAAHPEHAGCASSSPLRAASHISLNSFSACCA
jgi:LSD1 subclass zinc finger protein